MSPEGEEIDEYAAFVDAARASLADGADWEATLSELRRLGASVMPSIKVVRDLRGIPLDEAKDFVHFSRAWADLRTSHEALHAMSESAVEVWPDCGTNKI